MEFDIGARKPSMAVEVRNIVISDYDALVKFWTEQEGIHLNDADTRESIDRYLKRNPNMSFVAFDGDTVVGTALAGHDGRRGYLFHVGVAVSHQGADLGRVLLEHCYNALARAGIAKCYVFLLRGNESGKGYWSHHEWSGSNEFDLMSRWITKEGER